MSTFLRVEIAVGKRAKKRSPSKKYDASAGGKNKKTTKTPYFCGFSVKFYLEGKIIIFDRTASHPSENPLLFVAIGGFQTSFLIKRAEWIGKRHPMLKERKNDSKRIWGAY